MRNESTINILLIFLSAVILIIIDVGFAGEIIKSGTKSPSMSHGITDGYSTIVIDSCEYIEAFKKLAHKGNCRFCAERRKKDTAEVKTSE